jgi:ABC-2 type transport system permease protein
MNLEVIQGLVLRNVYLYTRNAVRFVELVFWPTVQLLVWGFLSEYLVQGGDSEIPRIGVFLIGALILWDALFRSQQGVSIAFLEDVWTRNLLNVFVAPVRPLEYLAATCVVGFLRICVTAALLAVMAAVLFAFNLFDLGLSLVPFYANLLAFGWCLGMVSTSCILRWGQAAESLAWAVPFLVQPFAAVFYPVEVLPDFLEPVALAFPCSHVFEGMREVMETGTTPIGPLLCATALNLVWLACAGTIYGRVLRIARRRGLLTKFASQ